MKGSTENISEEPLQDLTRPVRKIPTATLILAGAGLVLYLVFLTHMVFWAHTWDLRIFNSLLNHNSERETWHILLRAYGEIMFWFMACTAFFFADSGRKTKHGIYGRIERPATLLFAAGFSGLFAELMKMLIRRRRPPRDPVDGINLPWDGIYHWKPWADSAFSTSGIGFPSSHTAVAFGASFMLCWWFPRATPIWLLLAAGCGMTRVLTRAHFFSDVMMGALFPLFVIMVIIMANMGTRRFTGWIYRNLKQKSFSSSKPI